MEGKVAPRVVGWRGVVVCVVVGAVVNVVVAWACCLWSPITEFSMIRAYGGEGAVAGYGGHVLVVKSPKAAWKRRLVQSVATELDQESSRYESGLDLAAVWTEGGGLGASWFATDGRVRYKWRAVSEWLAAGSRGSCVVYDFGIPLRTVRSIHDFEGWIAAEPSTSRVWSRLRPRMIDALPPAFINGASAPVQIADQRVLAVRPVWSGIIVNTAVYSVLAFVVMVLPRVVRRVVRERAGRCVVCGYEVAGLRVCPECGTGVVRRGGGEVGGVVDSESPG